MLIFEIIFEIIKVIIFALAAFINLGLLFDAERKGNVCGVLSAGFILVLIAMMCK